MQNLIDVGIIIILSYLLFKNERSKVIILLLVALSIAPLPYIIGYKFDFSYIVFLVFFIYFLIRPRGLKFLISDLTFFVIFLILLNPVLSLISTLFAILNNSSRTVSWLSIIGTFKNISYIFVFGALTYRGLVLLEQHKNLNHFYSKIANLIITSLNIIMTLNLIFIVVQLFKPDLGIKIVTNWYSSASRSTLGAISQENIFNRLYGLNYSPVALGRMALLGLSSALFGIVDSINRKNKTVNLNKLSFLMLVSFLAGIFSFSRLFILGTLSLLVIFFVYSLINIFQKFMFPKGKFRFNFKFIKVVFLIILLFVSFYILFLNAETLGIRTGLPFSYYPDFITFSPFLSVFI